MTRRGAAIALAGALGLIGLFAVAGLWLRSSTDALGGVWLDSRVARWAADSSPGWLEASMRVVTWAGASLVVLAVLAAAAFTAMRDGRRRLAFFFALCACGLLLSTTVKSTVERPRPAVAPLTAAGGSAFPSGHTTAGAILFGAVAVAAVEVTGQRRWFLWSLCSVGAVLVGFSRIVLGVHWLSDVLGGLLLGGLWTAIAWRASS